MKEADKKLIHKYFEALERFNAWEDQLSEPLDTATVLDAVFGLYAVIPEQARQRPLNVDGIIKMHEALACLV